MTNVTIRMDEGLKKRSEALFEEMGLSMTAAITLFIKTAVRENRIPLRFESTPFSAKTTSAACVRPPQTWMPAGTLPFTI